MRILVISYFDTPLTKNYRINDYSWKELDEDHILITCTHGGWAVLSRKEFDMLRTKRLDDVDLFKQLEKEGILVTRGNENRVIDTFRRRKSFLFSSVNLHIISPTLRCNHRCIYCHAKSRHQKDKGYDMDEALAKKTVDFIFQSPQKHITIEFQGGEPLLAFPIVQYIVEYAKKLNETKKKHLKFVMVSNLTLMDRDIMRFIVDNKIGLCTSLDGPKEVHDKNRKYLNGKSSYEDVVHWINIIKKEYKYTLGALPTITKFSLPYCKEIVDEYRKQGFDSIRIRGMNNAGFAHELWKKIGYRPEEYVKFWKDVLDYILELNKKGFKIKEGMSMLAAKKFLSKKYINYTCWGFPCGSALSQCAYDHKGDVYACDEARSFDVFKIGNVEQSYKEVFLSPTVANIVSLSSGLLNECYDCVWYPFCGSCLVCTYGQQNTLLGNMSVDNECKIRKSILEHMLRKLVFSKRDRNILVNWVSSKHAV